MYWAVSLVLREGGREDRREGGREGLETKRTRTLGPWKRAEGRVGGRAGGREGGREGISLYRRMVLVHRRAGRGSLVVVVVMIFSCAKTPSFLA
jgi:hypothetical protein